MIADRLSIHRVFDILNSRFQRNERLASFLTAVALGHDNAIVTTNWDIAIERHLNDAIFAYGVPIHRQDGALRNDTGIDLLKLHGSSNWAYCDCCTRLYSYDIAEGKGALHNHIFLEPSDFTVLGHPIGGELEGPPAAMCWHCGVRLSSRVATFSYTKVLDFSHFEAIWERAFTRLRDAQRWIFIGYSLPEADFQLRHMLKSAQLGRHDGAVPEIIAVLGENDDIAAARFQQFFGSALKDVHIGGFEAWQPQKNWTTPDATSEKGG